jgi:hypothetical protein
MNEPLGAASHAGGLLPPMAARSRGPVQPVWEPSVRRLSTTDSVRAGAFLICYLAAYLAAGYAAITLIEWMWTRAFG